MTPTSRDSWDEAAIDRALAAALDVQPSADFRARVAARAAHMPAPRSRAPLMVWGALAAGLIVAVLLGRDASRPGDAASPPPQAAQPAPAALTNRPAVVDAARKPEPPVIERSHRAGARSVQVRGSAPRAAERAPALFDPRDREAFQSWLRTSSGYRPVPVVESGVPQAAPEIAPIPIEAIEIPENTVADFPEGEPHP